MTPRPSTRATAIAAIIPLTATLALALALGASGSANASASGSTALSHATTVGVHNAYDKDNYTYLAQSLDTGASLIELDVWSDTLSHRWRVSHGNPIGNDNNCVVASSSASLYTGNRNQDLGSCLADIRWWLAANPTSGPVFVKIEMKDGFDNDNAMGPDEFDSYLNANVGADTLFRPTNLLGTTYSTLDAAALADGTARIELLADYHASVVTCDWHTLTSVLSLSLARG